MAKIIFSSVVSAARGSVAGTVYSINANGAYLRNRGDVANRNTVLQQVSRGNLSAIAQAWRSLSTEQQNGWISGAAGFSVVDTMGRSGLLTGFQLFQKLNQSLVAIGLDYNTVCPTPQSIDVLAPWESSVYDVSVITLTNNAIFGGTGNSTVPADTSVVMEMTRPMSNGVNSPKRPDFRQIHVYQEASTLDADINIPNYFSVFGAVPAVGDNIFVRLTVVSNVSGERSSAQFRVLTIQP